MSEWQPIETAPRDGRLIFVARHMGSFGWVLGTSVWCSLCGIEGWVSRGVFDPPGELGLGSPTHWMPLPDPPEDTQSNDFITIADTLTHIRGDDGRMRQVVTAEMLRQVLDARGEPYNRPEGWQPEDEWDTGVRQ